MRCSNPRHIRPTVLAVLAALAASPAWATNGMNMEGYGPISTGMGGASQAIDHGTAALAQNPATLALMGDGARLDVALGVLGPHVTSSMPGMGSADSAHLVCDAGPARRRSGARSPMAWACSRKAAWVPSMGLTAFAAGSARCAPSSGGCCSRSHTR
jgi:hypothetical protein